MAPITTYGYSDFHGGTLELVTGALTTMIIRVNEIVRREFSVEFVFIDEIDSLIVLDPNNTELTDGNTGALINEASRFIIRRGISGDLYDVGHVFCTNAGGLAQLRSVCAENGKTRGVSCGFNPVGDSWYVGLVCHELGHQMGSPHSFNYCRGMNESIPYGFEPGSGSTIMSYAGICGARNVQFDSDPYYNIGSVETIVAHMHNGDGDRCAEKTPQGHVTPDITLNFDETDDLAIPISTPFELEAEAEVNGDTDVLYCWEQRDAGLKNCEVGEPEGNCPAFRSFNPTTDKVRVFPKIEDILFNRNSDYEVLPDYARSMRFSCTVRDWDPEGGVIGWDYVSFDVSDQAGPFTVSPISGAYEVGDPLTVEWDVAGTDEAPVNCKTVDIYLSEDGGFTYPHLLQAGVPNTGSYLINLPEITTNSAKIKVKGSQNIFFNLSPSTFSIMDADEPGFIARVNPVVQQACPPAITTYLLETQSFGGFANSIQISAIEGLPSEASFESEPSVITPGDLTEVQIDWGSATEGIFDLDLVLVADDADTIRVAIRSQIVTNNFEDLIGIQPQANAQNVPQSTQFRWVQSDDAQSYRLELATRPDFEPGSILLSEGLGDVSTFSNNNLLPTNTLIYWRVVPINSCGEGTPSPVRVFQTVQLDCQSFTSVDVPKVITAAGNGRTRSRLQIFETGEVANINVNRLRGTHQFIGDIAASLVSPSGTVVRLFENRCFNSTDFNISLNDASNSEVTCPLNQGRTQRPKDSLAILNGEELSGDWEILIEDRTPGTSGQLQGWGIEVCGSINVEKPSFSSDTIYVANGGTQFIRPQNMLAEKDGNNSGDLLYTVVEAPKQGVITHGQSIIKPGSQFIQYAIDSWHLMYAHNGENEDLDFFSVVLTDKDGGWQGIDTVYIKVDEVLSDNTPTQKSWSAFPNPARDLIHVSIPKAFRSGDLHLVNMFGQVVQRMTLNGSPQYTMPVYNLPKGMYHLRLLTENDSRSMKVLVQ
jgi:subtilisin-like proprotein convertase family protein